MSNKTPVFPMPEPQHFSDYGFDPQIDYFQVLEEARKHKHETSSSIETPHFKLQKPISKDEPKKKRNRWWRNPLLFFRWKKWTHNHSRPNCDHNRVDGVHRVRALSGPVYITESRSGSTSPYRTTSRPSSGPLTGILTPTRKGEVEVPYISLRELNMFQQHRIATSAMPIYMVT